MWNNIFCISKNTNRFLINATALIKIQKRAYECMKTKIINKRLIAPLFLAIVMIMGIASSAIFMPITANASIDENIIALQSDGSTIIYQIKHEITGTATINGGGVYEVSGNVTGSITVNTSEDVILVLNNATYTTNSDRKSTRLNSSH